MKRGWFAGSLKAKHLLLLSALFCSVTAAHAADYYQSNELGMKIAPITESQRGNFDWVLSVERKGPVETRTLTEKGTPVTRWEDTFQEGRMSTEKVYQKGELTTVTDFRNGSPVRRVDYSGGKRSTVREYSYSGHLLKSMAVFDAAGTLMYRVLFSEGTDGRLRRAVREMPDGSRSVITLTFAGENLITEWVGTAGDGVLYRYSGGSVVSKEQWKGTDLTTGEEILPQKNGTATITTDFQAGRVVKKVFDSSGRIMSERTTEKGDTIQTVDYAYSDGMLQSKVTKSPGQREETTYKYDDQGKRTESQTTVNRKLVKVTHYTGKDSYVEDLYLDGQVVLHVYYENGKKTKEVPAMAGSPTSATQGTAQ